MRPVKKGRRNATRKCFRCACQDAAQRIQTVRIDEVFNPRPLRNSAMAGILLIFSMLVFGIVFPGASAHGRGEAWVFPRNYGRG